MTDEQVRSMLIYLRIAGSWGCTVGALACALRTTAADVEERVRVLRDGVSVRHGRIVLADHAHPYVPDRRATQKRVAENAEPV